MLAYERYVNIDGLDLKGKILAELAESKWDTTVVSVDPERAHQLEVPVSRKDDHLLAIPEKRGELACCGVAWPVCDETVRHDAGIDNNAHTPASPQSAPIA